MEDIFRFMTVRPAQTPVSTTIDLTTGSQFEQGLAELVKAEGEAAFPAMVQFATSWDGGSEFVKTVAALTLSPKYEQLRARLEPVDPAINRVTLNEAIAAVFGQDASAVAQDASFLTDKRNLLTTILAIFVAPNAPAARGVSLPALAGVAQIIHVVELAADPAWAVSSATLGAALRATMVLPGKIFPISPSRIQPVGVADLLVVKQHIKRYELGQIQRIESLLVGESRKLTQKHTFATAQTTTTTAATTTETSTELTTDERFALQRQAQSTIQEELAVKGSVSVTAKYGDAVTVNANVNASYSNAKTNSTSSSTDYAKNVTQRAATKVTQTFAQTITAQVTETLEQDEGRTLDNASGPRNIIGIYQWLNSIYEAQVFNYGQRLLFDLVVPEPAALLLDAAQVTSAGQAPTPPPDFTLTPNDLQTAVTNPADPNYYGNFLARYDVEGLLPYPTDGVTVAKTFAVTADDKSFDKSAEVVVPDGYEAVSAVVNGMYNYTDAANNGMNIFVGSQLVSMVKQRLVDPNTVALNGETKSVAMGIETYAVSDYAITIEVSCQPTADKRWAWILDTHSKILAAWQKKVQDYQDAIAKISFQRGGELSPLGSQNPDENRLIEQRELKRSVIQMLWGSDFLGLDGVRQNVPPARAFPRPDPLTSQQAGRLVRFFEQAFEWENISYVCYPYMWGRSDTWYDKALRKNDDPIFESFLNAGAARVVLPVRLHFEDDVHYFLLTGQPWGGSDLPSITDSTYLPIAEEIKALSGFPESEVPQGPAWEISLPTSLVKLRADGEIPGWQRTPPAQIAEVDGWVWQANPADN
jgi:hypothetical protein